MNQEHRLRFKTLVMVLLMVVCANTGDLLLKRGMTQIGEVRVSPAGLWQALLATIHNPTIWMAILFLLGFTLCYMTAVSWADYSYVMPAGAFGYAVQTFLAMVVLHETVNAKRWFGVIVICIGVLLVGQTKPSTTSAVPADSAPANRAAVPS
jgi:uncharacterized membrane protein